MKKPQVVNGVATWTTLGACDANAVPGTAIGDGAESARGQLAVASLGVAEWL